LSERAIRIAAVAVVALVVAYLLVSLLVGATREELEDDAFVLLGPPLAAAALGLWGWQRASRRAARAREELVATQARAAAEREEARREAQERAREHEEERERLQRELRRREQALLRERQLAHRLQQSWRAEREWNRELRAQLQRMADRQGVLSHEGDVRELVLVAAIQLLGAEKGLLLSRLDEDGDGDLDLVLAHGFRHDPEGAALVQRFARLVLERDEVIREDDPDTGGAPRTPADDEVHELVAVPLYLRDRFDGVVLCANREGGFEEVDDEVLIALGDHAGAAVQNGQLRNELHEANKSVVRLLGEAFAAREPVRHGEGRDLAELAAAVARALGFDERQRDILVCTVLLRDVGLLGLSDRLLLRPGPLGVDERALVELHPRIGFNVIGQVPALRDVATAVLYHHERWDGGGYPAGLAGEAIPLLSRVCAVLDTFNALVHERPYRERLTVGEACAELVGAAGTQLDPELTALVVEHVRRAPPPLDGAAAEVQLSGSAVGEDAGLLSELATLATDSLTLLGSRRVLGEDVARGAAQATPEHPLAVVLVQLEDLERVNQEASFVAGDRLLQVAARAARRAATRVGGRAYRASGRRLAVVAQAHDGLSPADVLHQVELEFAGGQTIAAALAVSHGDEGDDVIARARRALPAGERA
jgi:HD-GYP domain-containing protein (c-di-GMP phosphodiesterase class II)